MNIKLKIIKEELESLRTILHFLLNCKEPTDKIVVSCSQQLDEVIIKYQKFQAISEKVA
ncbi:aspartyl-phosphate phosphatase Spo0E family protein [Clostridium estertheticum]|uniref:aspartyl-phosphate phosphatase Spo0E family protein n=1 Tax=Clostridium estertheticum TaxID=238834 RepID=UPI0013EE7812|nr:aspartyl-phosphate phosphatase Spo0E family protein [Clostridium estertheticum]MBZ9608592.1 aspartyl-phosphate phosphatase Spo0E family protein [Clostridium estertheticum]